MSHRLVRWLPAAIAPVVVAGAVTVPLVAAAAPSLPAKTPKQVLELALAAKDLPGFSGTVSQTSDLGLPSLPSTGDTADAASALDLLTGSHTLRMWARGDDQRRVAVLDETAERDAVVDGDSAWLWDSKKQTAVHVIGDGSASAQGTTRTPDEIADTVLTDLAPSTTLSVDTAQQVAGRDAYTLVLTPKTAATTVGAVRVAVDAATGLPLSLQVVAKGASSPAFSTAFTSLSTAVPDASTFDFTPPAGADVTTKRVEHSGSYRPLATGAKPTVTGEGWASVVEIPASSVPTDLTSNPTFLQASAAVAGGRAITSSLVNALVTTDGRVLVGAVPVSALQAAR